MLKEQLDEEKEGGCCEKKLSPLAEKKGHNN